MDPTTAWMILFTLVGGFALVIVPIFLVMRYKATKPNNMIVGLILSLLTPVAQYYPSDRYGGYYLIGMLIFGALIGFTLTNLLFYAITNLVIIAFRIKIIQDKLHDPIEPTK